MGTMHYDGATVRFDDRTLAHLQIVLVHHLRQGRSLMLNWLDSLDDGDGRSAVWIASELPVRFDFDGVHLPEIDPAWLRRLAASADQAAGLVVQDAAGRPMRALHSSMANR